MQEVVKPYEERKNGSGGKRVYQSGKKTAISTTATQYSALEYKNTVGILWPVAIYNASVDTGPPSRRLIQTHIINGQRVRGILRDRSHGIPPGCFEVYGLSGTSAEKSSVLANDGEFDDGAAQLFEQAQKRQRVATKATTATNDSGVETEALRMTGPVHVDEADSSDDNGLLKVKQAAWYASMSPEKKKMLRVKMVARYASMSPEDKERLKVKKAAWYASMSPEKKKMLLVKMVARYEAAWARKRRASMSPAQKEELKVKKAAWARKRRASMSPAPCAEGEAQRRRGSAR